MKMTQWLYQTFLCESKLEMMKSRQFSLRKRYPSRLCLELTVASRTTKSTCIIQYDRCLNSHEFPYSSGWLRRRNAPRRKREHVLISRNNISSRLFAFPRSIAGEWPCNEKKRKAPCEGCLALGALLLHLPHLARVEDDLHSIESVACDPQIFNEAGGAKGALSVKVVRPDCLGMAWIPKHLRSI